MLYRNNTRKTAYRYICYDQMANGEFAACVVLQVVDLWVHSIGSRIMRAIFNLLLVRLPCHDTVLYNTVDKHVYHLPCSS